MARISNVMVGGMREKYCVMGEGRMVLLVDDVMISGDPVEACAKSLAKSGALHVDVFWRGLSAPPLGPYSMETFV